MKKIGCKKIVVAISLATVVAFFPCAAEAHDAPPPPMGGESFIQHFDLDGDGLVSASEFPGDEGHFSEMDIDGSGFIDESEAPQGPPPGGPGASMDDLDQDGDGLLSESEFPGPPEIFDRLDTDGEGLLSESELAAERRPGPPPEQE